jgi:hypothetical protein
LLSDGYGVATLFLAPFFCLTPPGGLAGRRGTHAWEGHIDSAVWAVGTPLAHFDAALSSTAA